MHDTARSHLTFRHSAASDRLGNLWNGELDVTAAEATGGDAPAQLAAQLGSTLRLDGSDRVDIPEADLVSWVGTAL